MGHSLFQAGSSIEQPIAFLFAVVGFILVGIWLLVTVLVTVALVRFRHRAGQLEPKQSFGRRNVEIAWTAGPFLLLMFMFVLSLEAMKKADPPAPQGEPDLIITGHQWWWQASYPGSGAITANEIHVPAGRLLRVRLLSADVIHDWWVPQLGRKMDAIPGYPNEFWIEADQPGTYDGTCAEYCGAEHAWMRIRVIADTPAAFADWEQHQAQLAPTALMGDAAQGKELFETLTCSKCHSIRSGLTSSSVAEIGPDLTHVAERQTLASGRLDNSPANLERWLRDPQAVKPDCHMPNFQLSEQQVTQLAAYLEDLK